MTSSIVLIAAAVATIYIAMRWYWNQTAEEQARLELDAQTRQYEERMRREEEDERHRQLGHIPSGPAPSNPHPPPSGTGVRRLMPYDLPAVPDGRIQKVKPPPEPEGVVIEHEMRDDQMYWICPHCKLGQPNRMTKKGNVSWSPHKCSRCRANYQLEVKQGDDRYYILKNDPTDNWQRSRLDLLLGS